MITNSIIIIAIIRFSSRISATTRVLISIVVMINEIVAIVDATD